MKRTTINLNGKSREISQDIHGDRYAIYTVHAGIIQLIGTGNTLRAAVDNAGLGVDIDTAIANGYAKGWARTTDCEGHATYVGPDGQTLSDNDDAQPILDSISDDDYYYTAATADETYVDWDDVEITADMVIDDVEGAELLSVLDDEEWISGNIALLDEVPSKRSYAIAAGFDNAEDQPEDEEIPTTPLIDYVRGWDPMQAARCISHMIPPDSSFGQGLQDRILEVLKKANK